MKSKDVLKLLGVSRVTLCKYVRKGIIKVTLTPGGLYNYDDDDVFKFVKTDSRINIIYARVSTKKQKLDLITQIQSLKRYCKDNKIKISKVISEISSGLDLERKKLSCIIDDVIHYKIKNIYITYKDRLTRLSFKTLESIFKKFGTNIIVINDTNKSNSNDNEIFEELLSLLHIFSTTMYSKRRKKKISLIKNDLSIFK